MTRNTFEKCAFCVNWTKMKKGKSSFDLLIMCLVLGVLVIVGSGLVFSQDPDTERKIGGVEVILEGHEFESQKDVKDKGGSVIYTVYTITGGIVVHDKVKKRLDVGHKNLFVIYSWELKGKPPKKIKITDDKAYEWVLNDWVLPEVPSVGRVEPPVSKQSFDIHDMRFHGYPNIDPTVSGKKITFGTKASIEEKTDDVIVTIVSQKFGSLTYTIPDDDALDGAEFRLNENHLEMWYESWWAEMMPDRDLDPDDLDDILKTLEIFEEPDSSSSPGSSDTYDQIQRRALSLIESWSLEK